MVLNPLPRRPERAETDAPPELTLVQALELQAKLDGLSDRALMRECGLDKAAFVHVKQGAWRFSPESCAKIVERYPSMGPAAARYLAESYGRPALTLLEEASKVARRKICR